jgi:hypothetical protein
MKEVNNSIYDTSSILFTNLNLLKFQPSSQWCLGPYSNIQLDKFMFIKGTTYNQASEICLYFVLNKISPTLSNQVNFFIFKLYLSLFLLL